MKAWEQWLDSPAPKWLEMMAATIERFMRWVMGI